MTCIHCGEGTIAMEHTFRCTPDTRAPAMVDLHVCGDCLEDLLSEEDIQLVEPTSVVADH